MNEPVNAIADAARTPLDAKLRPRTVILPPADYVVTLGVLGVLGTAALSSTVGFNIASVLMGFGFATIPAYLVDRFIRAPRIIAKINAEIVEAGEARSRGDDVRAEDIYRAHATRYVRRPGLHALALFNVSTCRAAQGDVASAIAMGEALLAFPGTKRMPGLRLKILLNIALYHALVGRLTDARARLDEARRQKVKGVVKIYDANIEALILSRQNRFDDALKVYDAQWPDLERVFASDAMRTVRAQRAFAHEKVKGDDAELRRLIELSRPQRSNEYRQMTTNWPEMAEFLRRHGLDDG